MKPSGFKRLASTSNQTKPNCERDFILEETGLELPVHGIRDGFLGKMISS